MIVGYLRTMRPVEECQDEISALEKEGCEPILVDYDFGGEGHTPTLTALLEDMSAGDTLVVWALDDLARSVDELVAVATLLRTEGVGFRSVTDDFDSSGRASVMTLLERLDRFRGRSLARLREQANQHRYRVGRPRALSVEDVEHAATLIRQGTALELVAAELNVSRTTLYRYLEKGRRWTLSSYGGSAPLVTAHSQPNSGDSPGPTKPPPSRHLRED